MSQESTRSDRFHDVRPEAESSHTNASRNRPSRATASVHMHHDRLAARGDHAGLWDWNLATNRVHFSPRWIAMVGSDGLTLGNSPDAWLTRVHPDDVGELRC